MPSLAHAILWPHASWKTTNASCVSQLPLVLLRLLQSPPHCFSNVNLLLGGRFLCEGLQRVHSYRPLAARIFPHPLFVGTLAQMSEHDYRRQDLRGENRSQVPTLIALWHPSPRRLEDAFFISGFQSAMHEAVEVKVH